METAVAIAGACMMICLTAVCVAAAATMAYGALRVISELDFWCFRYIAHRDQILQNVLRASRCMEEKLEVPFYERERLLEQAYRAVQRRLEQPNKRT